MVRTGARTVFACLLTAWGLGLVNLAMRFTAGPLATALWSESAVLWLSPFRLSRFNRGLDSRIEC
jgi:hypothetical protein